MGSGRIAALEKHQTVSYIVATRDSSRAMMLETMAVGDTLRRGAVQVCRLNPFG